MPPRPSAPDDGSCLDGRGGDRACTQRPGRLAFANALVAVLFATGCAALGLTTEAPRGSIGAVLTKVRMDGRVFVRDVPPGLAADRGGLAPGDEVLLMDGKDVRRMTPNEIHLAAEGDVGSTIRLTIWRRGRVERVALTRTPLRQAP